MWPWEHLAFGYVLYTLGRRGLGEGPPSDWPVLALAVGTQFPDLIDKPLAWEFGVLPSGLSLAHSLLFALPVTAAAVAVATRGGRRPVGTAFSVGYLSHLLGDVLYSPLTGGELSMGFLLWPLVPRPAGNGELLATVGRLWVSFVEFLGTPRGRLYLAAELAFLALAFGLWLWDGAPGLPRFGGSEA